MLVAKPGHRALHLEPNRSAAMPYFTRSQDRVDRGGKTVADVFCALLLLVFAVVFFGLLGGLLAFLVLEALLLGSTLWCPAATTRRVPRSADCGAKCGQLNRSIIRDNLRRRVYRRLDRLCYTFRCG